MIKISYSVMPVFYLMVSMLFLGFTLYCNNVSCIRCFVSYSSLPKSLFPGFDSVFFNADSGHSRHLSVAIKF